jgi:hypothetical protein
MQPKGALYLARGTYSFSFSMEIMSRSANALWNRMKSTNHIDPMPTYR